MALGFVGPDLFAMCRAVPADKGDEETFPQDAFVEQLAAGQRAGDGRAGMAPTEAAYRRRSDLPMPRLLGREALDLGMPKPLREPKSPSDGTLPAAPAASQEEGDHALAKEQSMADLQTTCTGSPPSLPDAEAPSRDAPGADVQGAGEAVVSNSDQHAEAKPASDDRRVMFRTEDVAGHAADSEPGRETHEKRANFARGRSGTRETLRRVGSNIGHFARSMTKALTGLMQTHAETPPQHELGCPVAPKGKPDVADKVSGLGVAGVRAAVVAEGSPLYARFMTEALAGRDLVISPWQAGGYEQVESMTMTYTMPAPDDVPDMVRRIVAIPESISGRAVTWFAPDSETPHFTVKQRCTSEGVMYADRFHVEITLEARADAAAGGVELRQWVEVVWLKPLPWTASLLGKVIEKRVRSETAAKFPTFVRILRDLAADQR